MEEGQPTRLSVAGTKKRRSSILKSQRPPRTPFSELEFNETTPTESTRLSRRVSFSRRTGVAEFATNEATTTWKNVYVEHNKSDSLGNNSNFHQLAGETASTNNVEFSAVQVIDNDGSRETDDLDEIAKYMESSNHNSYQRKFSNKRDVSQYIEIDLDMTHGPVVNDESDMSITDTICSPKVLDISKNGNLIVKTKSLNENWVADKENIVINPYLNPDECDNFVINKQPEKVLVFTGKKLKYASIDADLDQLEESPVQKAFKQSSVVIDMDVEKSNLAQGNLTNVIEDIGPQSTKRRTIVFEKEDEEADISITQCISNKPIIFDNNKIQLFHQDYDISDMSVTEAAIKPIAKTKTILFENHDDLGNISITQCVPDTQILGNIVTNIDKTQLFTNDDNFADMSITHAISTVIEPVIEHNKKRKTILFEKEDVQADVSITQCVPNQHILGIFDHDKLQIYGQDETKIDMPINQGIRTETEPIIHNEKRKTILFEKEDIQADVSITQCVPNKQLLTNILLNNSKPQIAQDEAKIEMLVTMEPCSQNTKGNTIIFDKENVPDNISFTQCIPSKDITEHIFLKENITDMSSMLQNNDRKTILFQKDDIDGDISITQCLPNKEIIENMKYRKSQAFMSVSQAITNKRFSNIDKNIDKDKITQEMLEDLSFTAITSKIADAKRKSSNITLLNNATFSDTNPTKHECINSKPNDNVKDIADKSLHINTSMKTQNINSNTILSDKNDEYVDSTIMLDIVNKSNKRVSHITDKRRLVYSIEDSYTADHISTVNKTDSKQCEPDDLDEIVNDLKQVRQILQQRRFSECDTKNHTTEIHSLKRQTVCFGKDNTEYDTSVTQCIRNEITVGNKSLLCDKKDKIVKQSAETNINSHGVIHLKLDDINPKLLQAKSDTSFDKVVVQAGNNCDIEKHNNTESIKTKNNTEFEKDRIQLSTIFVRKLIDDEEQCGHADLRNADEQQRTDCKNVTMNINNVTNLVTTFDHSIIDNELQAPKTNFNISSFTETHKSKIFDNEVGTTIIGETTGVININFSAVQTIDGGESEIEEYEEISNDSGHRSRNTSRIEQPLDTVNNLIGTHLATSKEEHIATVNTTYTTLNDNKDLEINNISSNRSLDDNFGNLEQLEIATINKETEVFLSKGKKIKYTSFVEHIDELGEPPIKRRSNEGSMSNILILEDDNKLSFDYELPSTSKVLRNQDSREIIPDAIVSETIVKLINVPLTKSTDEILNNSLKICEKDETITDVVITEGNENQEIAQNNTLINKTLNQDDYIENTPLQTTFEVHVEDDKDKMQTDLEQLNGHRIDLNYTTNLQNSLHIRTISDTMRTVQCESIEIKAIDKDECKIDGLNKPVIEDITLIEKENEDYQNISMTNEQHEMDVNESLCEGNVINPDVIVVQETNTEADEIRTTTYNEEISVEETELCLPNNDKAVLNCSQNEDIPSVDGEDTDEGQVEMIVDGDRDMKQEDNILNDIISKINTLPFMGSKMCQWESISSNRWSFLLLHSRLRMEIRTADAGDVINADTMFNDVNIEILKHDEQPLVAVSTRVAAECARGAAGAGAGAGRARDAPRLLRGVADAARRAALWHRIMADAYVRLAYTLREDGLLTFKVANVPLRSVWEVSLRVRVRGAGAAGEARARCWPRAADVRVRAVVSERHVGEDEVRAQLAHVKEDWGHVPHTVWKLFKYLKNKTGDHKTLLGK